MRHLAVSVLVICALYSNVGHSDPPPDYTFLRYDEGLKQAAANGKKIFLYFGRLGCGYCDKTNTETFSDAGIHKLYNEHYNLIYVDAEGGERLVLPGGEHITEMELGARLNVYASPIFLYLEANGDVILRAPGFKTIKDLQDFDRYIQGGHYKHQTIIEFLSGKT